MLPQFLTVRPDLGLKQKCEQSKNQRNAHFLGNNFEMVRKCHLFPEKIFCQMFRKNAPEQGKEFVKCSEVNYKNGSQLLVPESGYINVFKHPPLGFAYFWSDQNMVPVGQ